MSGRVIVAIVVILLVIVSLTIHTPDQQQGIFTAEPSDVVITCSTKIEEVYFLCQNNRTSGRPQWKINSTLYSSNEINLPEEYHINGTTLVVRKVTPELNNTLHQCQIQLPASGTHLSAEGQLIIMCQAPAVESLPIYDNKSSELVAINTTINTMGGESTVIYTIIYSKSSSDEVCSSKNISASSCTNGVCIHIFKVTMASGLRCSNYSSSDNITVTVTTTNYDGTINFSRSDPNIIGAVNKLIQISLTREDEAFFIKCKFLHIDKIDIRQKILTVIYNGEAPDCRNQSTSINSVALAEVSIKRGNIIRSGMNLDQLGNLKKICFSATASVQGSKVAQIEGILEKMNIATSNGAGIPGLSIRSHFEIVAPSNCVTIGVLILSVIIAGGCGRLAGVVQRL